MKTIQRDQILFQVTYKIKQIIFKTKKQWKLKLDKKTIKKTQMDNFYDDEIQTPTSYYGNVFLISITYF